MDEKSRRELESKYSRILERLVQCQFCGEDVYVVDRTCNYCGGTNVYYDDDLFRRIWPWVQRLKEREVGKCPKCKRTLSELCRFCSECGKRNTNFCEELFIYLCGPVSEWLAQCEHGHEYLQKIHVFTEGPICPHCGRPRD